MICFIDSRIILFNLKFFRINISSFKYLSETVKAYDAYYISFPKTTKK